MKKTHLASAILLSATITSGAWAQDSDPAANSEAELDIIMSVVDEDDTPEDVINRIELPPAPEAVVELPDVELAEPPLDRAGDILDNTTRDAATTVTESVNDALSTGDLENLPEDITDALPEEVIEEVIDGVVDDIDDVDELIDELTNDTLDTGPIDSALDELEATGELNGTVDELDSLNDSVIEPLDDSLDQSGAVDEALDDLKNDVGGSL